MGVLRTINKCIFVDSNFVEKNIINILQIFYEKQATQNKHVRTEYRVKKIPP